MRKWIAKHETFALFIGLILVSAAVYLPFIRQIGYMNDDWYLMYAAKAYGPRAFIDIFSVDRPARALVMMPAYMLFGDNPLYYNLSAYAWRVISAFCFLWLLRMLWPRQRFETFLASLLFLIYPGFLSQVNGIDYQSQMVSLAAAMFSIALSVRASIDNRFPLRLVLIALSVLSGWLYLGLVEYFIGFEYLRLAALLLLAFRQHHGWWARLVEGAKRWLPNAFTPLVFLTWRLFFFTSERGATDVSRQVGGALQSSWLSLFGWVVKLGTDTLDVLFLAWGVPFSMLYSILRPRYIVLALLLSAAILFGLYRLILVWGETFSERTEGQPYGEMIFLGGSMVLAGLLPIILVNREVDFINFSRYSLASAVGVSLVVVAGIFHFLNGKYVRWGILSVLITLSVLTHHANGFQAALRTQDIRAFWWQVSWRVPGLEKGTTLVANYPLGNIQEDYFVWGPANLIYYPERVDERSKIRPSLYAIVLNQAGRNNILAHLGQEYDLRRNIVTYSDYQNILIISRPSLDSCVHLLDGAAPDLSADESADMIALAAFSQPKHVLLDSSFHTPSSVIFGPEPSHEWCFFYEKADLARQRGDWEKVIAIGEQAFGQGLEAGDPIEWMPFLQAYAQRGDVARLLQIKRKMKNADPWVMWQVCQRLSSLPEISPQTQEFVQASFCTP